MTKDIYAIKNNITNKIYVGRSQCVDSRIKSHLRDLMSGKHSNKEMQNVRNVIIMYAAIILLIFIATLWKACFDEWIDEVYETKKEKR